MKTWLVLLCCVAVSAVFGYGQMADEGYQPAKVVAFEHAAADARHMEDSDQYKISMRLGNTVYNCRGSGAATFIDWSVGKEFPARLNGKTLQVKNPNGELVELTIVGKKTAK